MKRKHSSATRRLLSKLASGKRNAFYGRKHSKTTKRRQSLAAKGKKNPMFGRRHSKSTIAKIRAAAFRRGK